MLLEILNHQTTMTDIRVYHELPHAVQSKPSVMKHQEKSTKSTEL